MLELSKFKVVEQLVKRPQQPQQRRAVEENQPVRSINHVVKNKCKYVLIKRQRQLL